MQQPVEPPRLRWPVKLAYGVGGIPNIIEQRGLSAFLLIFYNQVVGLPPQVVASVLLVTSCVDALLDPVIGQISDNFRSRWGRRHPFIYAAAIPIAICYLLIWCPPNLSRDLLAVYLLVTLLAVRLFSACFELPASALLPELTQNYDERTTIISLRIMMGLLGGLGLTMLAYRVFLKETPAGTGGVLARQGYFGYGLTAALIIAAAILIAAIGTHGRIPYLSKPPARRATLGAMLREVAATFGNRSFLALLMVNLLMSTASGAKSALELYFNLYFWGLSQVQMANLVGASLVGIVLGFLLAPALSRWLGKRNAAACMIACGMFGVVGPVLGRLAGVVPPNGSRALFAILFADVIFTICVATANAILLTALLNDVVEDVEVKTGRRSEGLLLAADSLSRKVVSSGGIFISGVMLTLIDFPQKAERGAVAPEVVAKLAYAYIPMLVVYIVALGALFLYGIDRNVHENNLRTLRWRARHGADPGAAQALEPSLAKRPDRGYN
jgi:GPH family glycoside/pentoside/hexuronide:cation symporter